MEEERVSDPPRLTLGKILSGNRDPVLCEAAGGQRGGARILPENEALVERALALGEETWTGLQTAFTQIRDPAQITEIKYEILVRLSKEDLETRKAQDGTYVLVKYIDTLGIREMINYKGEQGVTALMQAAVNGRWRSIKALLAAGADANIQNDNGETALMWAAAYGELSAVRELKRGARTPPLNYNLVDNLGWNALMVAAWCGHAGIVTQLAEYTDANHVALDGRNAAKLAIDPLSPCRIRGVSNQVIEALGMKNHPQQGGRRRTFRRSKTNSKKRGTR